MRICKIRDFEIRETLGEDLQVFMRITRIRKDSHSRDFGRGFARICKTLGEDSHGFMRLWERICKDLRDFGRGFARICEDLQGFVRIYRIHKDL